LDNTFLCNFIEYISSWTVVIAHYILRIEEHVRRTFILAKYHEIKMKTNSGIPEYLSISSKDTNLEFNPRAFIHQAPKEGKDIIISKQT